MIVILRIGHITYALPDDKGVSTVLRVMSKAQECRDRRLYDEGIELEPGLIKTSMEIVQDWSITKNRKTDVRAVCFPRGLPNRQPEVRKMLPGLFPEKGDAS